MPRLAGQIDIAKTEAILDAALEVLSQHGFSASMEEVARRACVSKQTIYNHYGSKAELLRALIARRVDQIVAPLRSPEADKHPQEALAAMARTLLDGLLAPRAAATMRLYVQGAASMPDLGQVLFETGPRAYRRRLAQFLERETVAGRLRADDPMLAAEFFVGMVVGSFQLAGLLGLAQDIPPAERDRISAEAAARFMRAYAV
jgi:TetR/AcrR family transcriptional regulator, mexJK operon transcriptional repressor